METTVLLAEIYSAAWWTRHYSRPTQRDKKAQAVIRLGLAVRAAFNASEDFEPLLFAVCDALAVRQDTRFAVGAD